MTNIPAKNHPWRSSYDPSGLLVKSKICEGCFETFTRPPGLANGQWSSRKYCDHACYMKINNTLKHPDKIIL